MIKLPYTLEMVRESKRLACELGGLKNSITAGAGNRSGILGEMALAQFLGATKVHNFSFDLIYKDWKVEVKSKRRTCAPKPFYEGSVAETSNHQKPDFYAFLSLTFEKKIIYKNMEKYAGLLDIWFCGVISYSKFQELALHKGKGETDQHNNFIVKTNMRNIRYDQLSMEWK